MSNDYFKFKHFTVQQSGAAMKVGTDGCLLGSWTPLNRVARILDIGTGTGIIALMLAQRLSQYSSDYHIDALDIEEGAIAQALFNVKESPWPNHISVFLQDILSFIPEERYDLIVSNPPYFMDSLQCPDSERTLARHNVCLPFDLLCRKSFDLLNNDGVFCVILPMDGIDSLITEAIKAGFFLRSRVNVHTTAKKAPKRGLLEFCKSQVVTNTLELILQDGNGYSEPYKELMRDFYLKL